MSAGRIERKQVIDFLVRFTDREELRDVRDEATLDECGLDSLAAFDFIVGLEREFSISIDDEHFNIENFRTIGAITSFLEATP